MSNYPIGANKDPRAPYNEPLNKSENFNISVVCDIDKTISVPEDITDFSSLKDNLKHEICNLLENIGFNVCEIIVTHD